MSHEMEMEDYMVDLRRKVAIVEEQNQAPPRAEQPADAGP
jgi:hypothetical protein